MNTETELGLNEGIMGVLTVDGRELHELLEIDEDFETWIQTRINRYRFSEGKDYRLSREKRPYHQFKKYSLTLDVASYLENAERQNKLPVESDGEAI